MAGDDVDPDTHAVLDDHQRLGRRLAKHPAGHRLESFEPAHIGIGSLVDACAAARLAQRGKDRPAPFLGTGRRQLHHKRVTIAIDNQARQAIRLAVNQPQTVLPPQIRHRLTTCDGGVNVALEEDVVDDLVGVERPYPGAYLRLGAPRRPRQGPTVGGDDVDRVTRPGATIQPVNDPGKNPGVPTGQRAILAGEKNELSHCRYPAPGDDRTGVGWTVQCTPCTPCASPQWMANRHLRESGRGAS